MQGSRSSRSAASAVGAPSCSRRARPTVSTVVAIDPHAGNDRGPQGAQRFRGRGAERSRRVHGEPRRSRGLAIGFVTSASSAARAHDAIAGSTAVLYIDGAHRYAPARADIRAWGARVGPGGTMLIHDSFSSVGVTLAIVRELMFGRRFRYIGRSRSLTEYRADLALGWRARALNAAASDRAAAVVRQEPGAQGAAEPAPRVE